MNDLHLKELKKDFGEGLGSDDPKMFKYWTPVADMELLVDPVKTT
ncbi:MAG: hypothetical protein NZT61_00765 [Deltaproteobacteria bacterium]|nr:hypothetical protein [Deltaproteobacteria bacterium]